MVDAVVTVVNTNHATHRNTKYQDDIRALIHMFRHDGKHGTQEHALLGVSPGTSGFLRVGARHSGSSVAAQSGNSRTMLNVLSHGYHRDLNVCLVLSPSSCPS